MARPTTFAYANFLGIVTCIVSRGRDVRGDHTALALIMCASTTFCLLCHTTSSHTAALLETLKLCCSYLSTVSLITIAYRLSPWHPLAAYPGPSTAKLSSLWLSYISFTGKRYNILDGLHKRYGPFLRIGPAHLSINSPSAVSLYLNTEKSESYRFPGRKGAVSLFFKQDTSDLHRHRRRVWSEFFTRASISGLMPQLDRRTWELVQCLDRRQDTRPGNGVDLAETLYHWSHDVMGDTVFGGCSTFELMKNGDPQGMIPTGKMATAMMDSLGQTPWLLDILWHMPFTKKMHALEEHAAHMMNVRAKSQGIELSADYRDLASYLIAAGLPQHDLETDAIVAIIGGSDNTSITVAIAIYFLLVDRQYYQRLYDELAKTFHDPMVPFQAEELAALPFLNAVLNETLRLASPYFNPRVVPPGGAVVDGKYIPEKTVVALAAHSQQTSAENFYPDPQDFLPERWIAGELSPHAVTNRSMLASFSYGPHYCIGKALAYHQMRFALARIVLTFDIEFATGFDIAAFRAGILNMRTMFLEKELRVQVRRRQGVDLANVPA